MFGVNDMLPKERLIEEIELLPEELINEVSDFIEYLKVKNLNQRFNDITLASQESLEKDWSKPEEEEAWSNL